MLILPMYLVIVTATQVQEIPRPKRISLGSGLKVCSIACGGMHTLAVTTDGKVWSWGVNDEGSLGRIASKDMEGSESSPQPVAFPDTFTSSGDSIIKVCIGQTLMTFWASSYLY